jgi:hypothetical protein
MSDRVVHLSGGMKNGVLVPFCETKGAHHVTASPSWVDCKRCINKWNKEVLSGRKASPK